MKAITTTNAMFSRMKYVSRIQFSSVFLIRSRWYNSYRRYISNTADISRISKKPITLILLMIEKYLFQRSMTNHSHSPLSLSSIFLRKKINIVQIWIEIVTSKKSRRLSFSWCQLFHCVFGTLLWYGMYRTIAMSFLKINYKCVFSSLFISSIIFAY